MSSRLTLALALSLVLHGSLLFPDALPRLTAASSRPPLQAVLRPPPRPEEAPPAEPLLKNTLAAEPTEPTQSARPAAVLSPARKTSPTVRPASAKQAVKAAQKKLSQHLYYPPEAVRLGIEGEVRLLVTLAADGRIADVVVAASSGHPILDHAAVKAVYAMGALGGTEVRELILPVIFRLQ